MNMRDEVTWRYQHEDAHEEGGQVKCQLMKSQLNSTGTVLNAVSLGIELHYSREMLQGEKSQSDDIAQ